MDLSTTYLGLKLPHPIMPGASPMVDKIDLVKRMERKGLIARRRDPADARRNTVTLTDAGRSERARLRPLVDQVQDALVASMSPNERRALRAGLIALLRQDERAT